MARLIDHYDGESGVLLVRFPRECALDCSTPGQPADDAVTFWIANPRVRWIVSTDVLRRVLRGYGAWDDLQDAPEDTIRGRVLWIAACDWRESRRR